MCAARRTFSAYPVILHELLRILPVDRRQGVGHSSCHRLGVTIGFCLRGGVKLIRQLKRHQRTHLPRSITLIASQLRTLRRQAKSTVTWDCRLPGKSYLPRSASELLANKGPGSGVKTLRRLARRVGELSLDHTEVPSKLRAAQIGTSRLKVNFFPGRVGMDGIDGPGPVGRLVGRNRVRDARTNGETAQNELRRFTGG